MKTKILAILGPTASGKSALAVELAKKFNGEVISADSRQVYKGLDLGTGKITKEEMQGVPHHLLDVADPKESFSVEQFKKLAQEKITEIAARGKLPILCGGTGFYISAVVDDITLPEVRPNPVLRAKLEKESTEALFEQLEVLDPDRAASIDPSNKVRIIRAIEIASSIGKVPHLGSKVPSGYETLQIGLLVDDVTLRRKIHDRLLARIEKGMIEEVEELHASGLSWERLFSLGLEYRYIADFLQRKCTKEVLVETLTNKTWQYSRRQLTWFKRDKRIRWFNPDDMEKIIAEVTRLV